VTATLVLPERFNGPPMTANGGYATGRLAAFVESDDAVEVTLRLPPPLGRALAVARGEDGRAVLLDGEAVASALLGPDGAVRAIGRAVWIALQP
jgi:hypothetical protein